VPCRAAARDPNAERSFLGARQDVTTLDADEIAALPIVFGDEIAVTMGACL
jgi:hypothetical protein